MTEGEKAFQIQNRNMKKQSKNRIQIFEMLTDSYVGSHMGSGEGKQTFLQNGH